MHLSKSNLPRDDKTPVRYSCPWHLATAGYCEIPESNAGFYRSSLVWPSLLKATSKYGAHGRYSQVDFDAYSNRRLRILNHYLTQYAQMSYDRDCD